MPIDPFVFEELNMNHFFRTLTRWLVVSLILLATSALVMRAHAADASVPATVSEPCAVSAEVVHIVLSGPVDLQVRAAASPSCLIRGDARRVGKVAIRQDGQTLHIGTKGLFIAFGQHTPTRVELTVPNLNSLQVSGSGDAWVQGFRGAQVSLVQSGAGDVRFEGSYAQWNLNLHGSGDLRAQLGQAERVDLLVQGSGDARLGGHAHSLSARLQGSGDVWAEDLHAREVDLQLQGSGDARVWAEERLQARLSGSGDAHVQGNPGKRNVERTGSGEVFWE
jgi:hypothetical protein